jgi:HAD superfamily hydrolase (TIGR01509 family)
MYSYIFDLGGVLVDYNYEKLVNDFFNLTKGNYDAIRKLFSTESLYPVETGRITSEEFYKNHVLRVMPNLSFSELLRVYSEHFNPNLHTLNLIKRLKQKGRKTYILSNLAELHKKAAEIRVPGIFNLCDDNFLSYELGYHKPEAEIYLEVCKRIGTSPQNCVFFDDTEANVNGARKIAMKSMLYSKSGIDLIEKYISELEGEII